MGTDPVHHLPLILEGTKGRVPVKDQFCGYSMRKILWFSGQIQCSGVDPEGELKITWVKNRPYRILESKFTWNLSFGVVSQ